jgi:plastocyanin
MSKLTYFSKLSIVICAIITFVIVINYVLFKSPTNTLNNYYTNSNNPIDIKSYDFYLRYGEDNKINADTFLPKLETKNIQKIKIESMPNHSLIMLNGEQLNKGDYINFTELDNIIIRPEIDEYDSFIWSAFSDESKIKTIVSKFGVGLPAVLTVDKTTLSNVEMNFTSLEFTQPHQAFFNSVLGSVSIASLPTNGTLMYNNTPVTTTGLTIAVNDIPNLSYKSNSTYTGNDIFILDTFLTNSPFVFSSFDVNITVTNEPPTMSPQNVTIQQGQTATFPGFAATDSSNHVVTFAHTSFPVGLNCTETLAGQSGNIISCTSVITSQIGTYTFEVTPTDSINLSGNPVQYSVNVTEFIPPTTPPSNNTVNTPIENPTGSPTTQSDTTLKPKLIRTGSIVTEKNVIYTLILLLSIASTVIIVKKKKVS